MCLVLILSFKTSNDGIVVDVTGAVAWQTDMRRQVGNLYTEFGATHKSPAMKIS